MMASSTQVRFHMDDEKRGEHRIPFELSAGPFYSESNMRYLTKDIDGIESGERPLIEHEWIEADGK